MTKVDVGCSLFKLNFFHLYVNYCYEKYTNSIYANYTSKFSIYSFRHSSQLASHVVDKTKKENLKPRKELKSLKFLQVNLQKSKSGQHYINGMISKYNKAGENFICLVQEPISSRSRLVRQPNSVQRFSVGGQPRATIYASTNINAWLLETMSDKDMVAIQTEVLGQQVIIVSAYLDYTDRQVISNKLYGILDYAQTRNLGIVIGADSNCHSSLFGPTTNKRGEVLEDFIANSGLVVENIGHTPTYESRGNSTCIDCTLSRNLNTTIIDWHVNQDYNGSDHNTIFFSISHDLVKLPRTWKWHRADWNKFSKIMETIETHLPKLVDYQCCEEMLQNLYTKLNSALKQAVPRSKPKIIDKNNPWWNEEFTTKRRNLNKLYKKQRLFPTNSNIRQYKEEHRLYKLECERARLKSWHNLQTDISSVSEMNVFRKILEGSSKVSLGTLTRADGTFTEPGSETIDELIRTHFITATDLKPTPKQGKTVQRREIHEWEQDIVTETKVRAAFKAFQTKKSPGTDNIPPIILKHLPDKAIRYIMTLYKVCLRLHYTPTKWKECKLVFIPKPGKGSYHIAKAWRPISLTNYLLKALEKLCCWHMDEKIALKPLHPRQHGFRSDRNTETATSGVSNYIEKHIFNEEHVIGVFLDIQAAFDTILPEKVRDSLLLHDGNPDMVNWYYKYISHRNLHIKLKGHEKAISSSLGFPQGGVCSAKFWIIAFNEAISIINERGIYGNGFADDCVALAGGTNLDQMMSRMQKVVSKLEEWGIGHGLRFNAQKTEVVIFSKGIKVVPPNNLIVGGESIPFSTQAKYLGLILDSKLTWKTHIDKVITRAKQYIFMLRQAVSKKWGPRSKFMKWIYTAIIKPRISYACINWAHMLRIGTRQDDMNRINKLMVAILSNTRHSTPRLALEVMYGLPPLDLELKREALASLIRNRHTLTLDWEGKADNKPTFIGHLLYWEHLAQTYGLDLDFCDSERRSIWDRNYQIDEASYRSTTYPIQSQINIYTDGSRTDEHTGAGFVIYTNNSEAEFDSVRLPDYGTVFQGEMLAIKLAAERCYEKLAPGTKYIKLFSDSQAALKSLNKPNVKSKLVAQTIAALNNLGRQVNRLQLSWIKAHANHKGNERADELARNAVFQSITYFDVHPPMSYVKAQLVDIVNDLWTQAWTKGKTCRMTKLFYPVTHYKQSKTTMQP